MPACETYRNFLFGSLSEFLKNGTQACCAFLLLKIPKSHKKDLKSSCNKTNRKFHPVGHQNLEGAKKTKTKKTQRKKRKRIKASDWGSEEEKEWSAFWTPF